MHEKTFENIGTAMLIFKVEGTGLKRRFSEYRSIPRRHGWFGCACALLCLPSTPPLSNRAAAKMAAPSNAERSPERSAPLKTPKTELPSPESDELSDGNQYHSDPSAPNRFSSLNVSISGMGAGGGPASASNNSSGSGSGGGFTVCRGMSWTPSETNALIAVWGNERLAEARMQQLEVAGTVFSGKAPGPAMYERVSRALSELGYDRTPSQCRERMKVMSNGQRSQTARSVQANTHL